MNKLIIVDGGDGAGKKTQSQLLVDYLSKSAPVTFFDFPRYKESVFGGLTGNCLSGILPDGKPIDFVNESPYISSLTYMLDRASAKDDLYIALETSHVICNRYVPSNIVYHAAKLPQEKRENFIRFIEVGEYGELKLPKPDLVVYLKVAIDMSQKLIEKKERREYLQEGQTKDLHEQDLNYQQKVVELYCEIAEQRDNWHIVECMKDGKMLTEQDIHAEIVALVNTYIKTPVLLA